MIELIIFLLATTGLTLITNKSTIFKPFRVWIAHKFVSNQDGVTVWSWLNGIFNCGQCMSIYTGTIVVAVMYFGYTIFLYPLCATTIVTAYFKWFDKSNRV